MIDIGSPLSGKLVPLEEVKDEAFSKKMMGEGIAIIPSEGKVFSPADGVVDTLCDTCHAIGIHTDSGSDVLIHIGRDTVELAGKYFKARVKEGERVKKGSLLIEFNGTKIQKAGYDITTPVTIINSGEYKTVSVVKKADIECGDTLLTLEEK